MTWNEPGKPGRCRPAFLGEREPWGGRKAEWAWGRHREESLMLEVMLSRGQCHWIKRPGKYFAETTVGTCTSKCCFLVPTKLPPVLWEYVTSSNHTASLKLKMVPRVGCDLKPPFLGAYTISPAQGSVGYRTSGSGVWHPAYPESAGRMCLLSVFWVLAHHPVNLGSEDGRTTKSFTCIRQDHCMYLVGGPDPSLWCRPHLLPHFDGTQGEWSSYLPVMCCTPRSLPCLELTWLEGPALQLWGVCDAPGRPVHGAAVGKGGWSQPWLELSHKEGSSSVSPTSGKAPCPNSIKFGGLCVISSL